jgi:RNA polymerase sigma-70 factor (ECF subfamily)
VTLSDEKIKEAAGGSQRAFADIVDHHKAMVFSIALHFLQNRSWAEEIAQEVFLQLFRSLITIESLDHLTFWLRRTTSHRCIDWARNQSQQELGLSLDEVPELKVAAIDRDPLLAERLRQLVASLPPEQRLVVTLRFQEDLDPSEIARVLEMPVNTVKSRLRRALALLERKLSSWERIPV